MTSVALSFLKTAWILGNGNVVQPCFNQDIPANWKDGTRDLRAMKAHVRASHLLITCKAPASLLHSWRKTTSNIHTLE